MTDQPFYPGQWEYRRSLASRVTLLTTLAVGLSLAFMALGATVSVRMQMQHAMDESLLDRANRALETQSVDGILGAEIPSWVVGAVDVRVMILRDGRAFTIGGREEFEAGRTEWEVAATDDANAVRTIRGTQGESFRVVSVNAGAGEALLLAQSLEQQEQVLERASAVLLVFGGIGIFAAALAGWGVARNGLRPVRRLTSTVEEIARTEDLTLLVVEGDDEIARLARAFNTMLTAVAASRDRQRRLVADAGHELRTPLTSLRTNLDLLAQADTIGGLPPEARQELLNDVRAQAEELSTLVGDLVELAREDHATFTVERIDLAEAVDRAVARVRRRAPGLAFSVHAESWPVVGNAAALERAVTNLLDNAAKWSPVGGTVTVTLAGGLLTVDDEGPGISEGDAPHVFERFYRARESRTMPGSGLGLSIVKQVAARHGGTVSASRAPTGGARVSLALPGAPA